MNCEIVKDLIPLYIDGCCSNDSRKAVEEHLKTCEDCKTLLEEMSVPQKEMPVPPSPVTFRKVNQWRASVLQSVLLFISFGLITLGVYLEARTPTGGFNGFWAYNLVIPSTGFMLSLANWYFVNHYKSKKQFTRWCWLSTLGITLIASLWTAWHYETTFFAELFRLGFFESVQLIFAMAVGLGAMYVFLAVLFCILSKLLSGKYATLLGKE